MVGKKLTELTYEIDTLRLAVRTVFDDKACICRQEDGTLAFFDHEYGEPYFYWCDQHEAPHDNREDYTSVVRFVSYLKKHISDPYILYLVSSPVWHVIDINVEDHPEQMYLPMETQAKVIDFKTRKQLA